MESYLTSTKRDESNPAPIGGLPIYNRELGALQIYDAGWFWRTTGRHIAHDLGVLACWDPSRGISVGHGEDVGSWVDRVGGYELVQTTAAEKPHLSLVDGPQASRALEFDQTDSRSLTVTDTDFDDLPAYTYSAWVSWSGDTVAGHAGIVSKGGATKRLEIDTTDGSLVAFHDTDGTDAESQSAAGVIPNDGTWTHVALQAYSGWAREFYGTVAARLETHSVTPIGLNDLTVFGWVWVDSSGLTNGRVFNSDGVLLYHGSDGVLRFYYPGGSLKSTTAAPAEAWHFVVYTMDRDGALTLYVDDMTTPTDSEADISAGEGENLESSWLIFGETMYSDRPYTGRMCGLGWCVGNLLSQAERTELYNGGKRIAWDDISVATQGKIDHYWEGGELEGPMLDKSGDADAYGAINGHNYAFDGSPVRIGHAPGPGAPTLHLFVNGEEVTYVSQTPGTGDSVSEATNSLDVGYSQAASDYFDGHMGEVIVDDTVYPDDVYRTLYNATKPQT